MIISKNILKLLFLIIVFTNGSAYSTTITCDNEHIIQAGDTLSKISLKVYDDTTKWNIIYLQNKQIIGSNSSAIKVGSALFIPCLNRFSFNETKNHPVKLSDKTENKKNLHVDFVTAEWLPYVGKKLPNQGMLLDITKQIFSQFPDISYSVDYISDWSAHINTLLKKNKYDIGPGWYYQDCSDMSKVPESAKIRCEYHFSSPIYKEIITIYNKKNDSIAISNLSELKNKTLCQPEGYLLFDYKKSGLENGKNFTLIESSSVKNCIEKLRDNEVQYVAINKNEGDQVISNLGLKDEIENSSDSPMETRSLHFIIHKTNPKANMLISKINKGLKKLENSGELFRIQSKHIQNFQNNL